MTISARNLIAVLGLSAAATGLASAASAEESVSLRLSWLLNVQSAGYVMADAKGFYNDVGLDVDIMPGGPNLNSTAMVAAGQNTFGTNDISAVLFGEAEGMEFAVVGACFQKNPAGLLSLAETGIKEPKDLEGKTLAYNEGGPWSYTQAMLAKSGVDMSKVNTVVIMGNEVLMSGRVDAKTAFVVNEPIALELQGYPTATLVAADYGVNAYAETIFTTASYAEEHPDIVEAFMQATAKGWAYAFDHPEEAVDAVLAINGELDPEQQSRQLELQRDFILTDSAEKNGICSVETANVADTYDILKEYAGLEADIDIDALVKPEFAAKK